MKQLTTDRKRDLQALGLMALVVLAWLWPVTLGGRLLSPADMLMVMQPWKAHARELGFQRVQTPFLDAIQQHYPWRKFAAEQLRQGEVPLWNPYMFCGTPFVANNQSAVFYPETWLFALMAPERAFGWSALVSLILGGSFMFYFLRLLGLRRTAALAGTLPFLMSGFLVGWLLLPTVRAVPMWLPLMLLAYELAVRRRSLGWAATCGLAVGMQFLAGHLHVSLLVLLVFGVYVTFRVVQEALGRTLPCGEVGPGKPSPSERPTVTALRAFGYAAFAFVSGTLLAAIQLLPVLELVGMNPRKAGMDFAQLAANRMMPVQLLAGLMPDLFGNPVDYNFWGAMLSPTHREYVETVWYCGIAALLLLGAALAWKGRRTAQTWLWFGLWLGGLGMAWGTAVYWVIFKLIPPLRQLPGVSRGVFVCCFATAVLAAMGVEAICRQVESGQGAAVKRLAALAGLGLGLIALAGGIGVWMFTGGLEQGLPGIGAYTLLQMGRALVLVAAGAAAVAAVAWKPRVGLALLGLVMTADLLYFAGHFTPEVPAKYLHCQTQVVEFLQARTGPVNGGPWRMTSLTGEGTTGFDRMPPNTTMFCGLQDVQGSDSLVFEGYSNLMVRVPRDDKDNPAADSPVFDFLSCRYVVSTRNLAEVPGWRLALDAECPVWENTQVLPRAYLAAGESQTATASDCLARVTAADFDPRRETLTPPLAPWTPVPGRFAPLAVTAYAPNRLSVTGNLAAKRLAVVSEAYYPGWHAFVDGVEQRMVPVNGLLRGVLLDQPGKRLEMVYTPGSFAVGAFLSCLALGVLAGVWVAGRTAR